MDQKDLNELHSLEELAAYQVEVRSRIQAIHSETNGLPFDAEQRDEFAALTEIDEEITKRQAELEARERVLERIERLADNPRNTESGDSGVASFYASKPKRDETRELWAPLPPMTQDQYGPAVQERAKKAIEQLSFSEKVDADKTKARLEHLVAGDSKTADLVWKTANPVYERAFYKRLLNKQLSAEEQRVLSISGVAGDGTEGNLAVPVTIDPTLILTSDGVTNPLRRISRVVNITGNEWRGIAADAIVASYDPEMTETDDDSPTLSQPVINVEKAQAFVPFSIEIGEDWTALRTELTRAFQDAKDTLEAEMFLTGAGHASNEPEGLLVGATNSVPIGGTFDEGDLYALADALPDRYQGNASIILSRAVGSLVRQFGSADNGLWADSLQAGQPSRLIGYPVFPTSGMSATAGAGDAVMVIGDFNRFVIVDRVGLNVELVPHLFGTARNYPNGMRGLYAYWRNSSGVVDANAFRVLGDIGS